MKTYVRLLKQRVRQSRYAVGERAVAEAILKRATNREASRRIRQFHFGNVGPAAAVSARWVRRATAGRASDRGAAVRSRQGEIKARIIESVAWHPGRTAGDVAKSLNMNAGSVSTRLTQLASDGEIERAADGYGTGQAALPRADQRPLRRAH